MEMDDRFEWRETYFILFPSGKRPALKQVEKAVRKLGVHFELSGQEADDEVARFAADIFTEPPSLVIWIGPVSETAEPLNPSARQKGSA